MNRVRQGDLDAFNQIVVVFQDRIYNVVEPKRLCNPVDKEGEGIINPDNHLMCYKVEPVEGELLHERVKRIHINNQFGPLEVKTDEEKELCVPSLKTLP